MTEESKTKRLYLVQQLDKDGNVQEESIVEASSQSGAIALKAKAMFAAQPAKPRDVARVYGRRDV